MRTGGDDQQAGTEGKAYYQLISIAVGHRVSIRLPVSVWLMWLAAGAQKNEAVSKSCSKICLPNLLWLWSVTEARTSPKPPSKGDLSP